MKLYGFYSEEERTVFEIVLNATGVGPKLAVAILSTYTTEEIKEIIVNEDVKMLSKVPGIGVKKGQKLILDIKDKMNLLNVTGSEKKTSSASMLEQDILLAMESLGYGVKDLEKLVSKEEMNSYTTIEEAIKDILKKIRK